MRALCVTLAVVAAAVLCVARTSADDETPVSLDASRITLKVQDAPLGEVLAAVARQSGNQPLVPPGDAAEKRVTLELADVPYWQALDKLCTKTGLAYEPSPRMRALRLVRIERQRLPAADVTAHAGPFEVTLRLGHMRRIRPRVDNRDGAECLRCVFLYLWEDRLPTMETELVVTRMTAPDGSEVPLVSRSDLYARLAGGFEICPVGTVYYDVESIPKELKRVRTIEGLVRVTFGVGSDAIAIPNVLGGGVRSATVGKSTLSAEPITAGAGRRWLKLRETFEGQEVNPTIYPADSPFAIVLVDPKGGRHIGLGRWGGMLSREGQIVGPDGQPEGGQVVKGPGETLVRFDNLPDLAGAWTLVHTVPRKLVTREYPFRFDDVVLP
ncbi:MAG TPA: hypothetical protein VMX57_08165 [Planctomycetota bacterium]|nr:hypothetical protein [Planctomycetota bacterium]